MEPGAIPYVTWEQNLDQQTVHAGMMELQARLCEDIPVFMLPPAACTAYAFSEPTGIDAGFIMSTLDSSLFVVGAVWAPHPDHFTLFRAERKQLGLPWETEFWDPLTKSFASSRHAAQSLLRNLELLPPWTHLNVPEPGPQTDGWSCGLQVLAKLEAWMRERRGEQPGLAVSIQEVQSRLNEFLTKLKAAEEPGAQSSGPAAGSSGPATEGSGAAAAASGPAKAAPVEHATFEIALEAGKEDSSMPDKRLYPHMQEDSSPQAKRSRHEDDIACSRSPLSQVSLVWILWKGMTVSFC